jgi:hypothetical protein
MWWPPDQTGSPAATRRVVRATSRAHSVLELPPIRRSRQKQMKNRYKESLQNGATKRRDKTSPPKVAKAFIQQSPRPKPSWRFFVTQFCRDV